MLMSLTPGSRFNAFSTLIAQALQSMPSTRILSAFSAASLATDLVITPPRIFRRDVLYGPCTNYSVNPTAAEQLTIGDLAKAAIALGQEGVETCHVAQRDDG